MKTKLHQALVSKMRVFDIKRSEYYSGKISKNTRDNLEQRLKEFISVTSSKEEDRPTRAK